MSFSSWQQLTVPVLSHPHRKECPQVRSVSVQSLDDAGVRHALPPAALLQSAHTLAEVEQAVEVSARKDVLCPFKSTNGTGPFILDSRPRIVSRFGAGM